MPQFDLHSIYVAKYNNNNGAVSYSNGTKIGDAMNVNIQLRFAEARLYAESRLAEYVRKCVGGTISIGEKYIPDAAQKLMFGAKEKTRTVSQTSVTGLEYGSKDVPNDVGVGMIAPDMVDGDEKYTCVLVKRALFGPPSMSLQTMGQNIQFNTPTVTGEFMPDQTDGATYLEVAVLDDAAKADAWVKAALNISE